MMYCFDRTRRLRNKKDYELVFNRANKITTSDFVVLHKKNNLATARLGLAISKKALSLSCQRNRVKRILRESFRQRLLPTVDIVVMAKHGIANKDNATLFKNLSIIWDKLAAFYVE